MSVNALTQIRLDHKFNLNVVSFQEQEGKMLFKLTVLPALEKIVRIEILT